MENRINLGYQEYIKARRGVRYSLGAIIRNAPGLKGRIRLVEDPEERYYRSLPLRIQEYIEVGKMLDSGIYPQHKVVLLVELKEKLLGIIHNDNYLFQSLMTWNLRNDKQVQMRPYGRNQG